MSSTLTASQTEGALEPMEIMGLSVGEFWPWIVWFVFVVVLLFGSLYWAWQKKPIFGVILCSICFAIIGMGSYFFIDKFTGEKINDKDDFANWMRGIGLLAGAFLAAPVGLYLAYKRTDTLGQQTQNEGKRIISEEFSRSIDQLGNQRASVRQGGIYALGRLAKDNEEMRDTIMRIICSFVRGAGKKGIAPNGTDVEAALYVIRDIFNNEHDNTSNVNAKNGDSNKFRYDISNANIKNGDLSRTNLKSFNLSDMEVNGCIFQGTDFGPIFDGDSDSQDPEFLGAILSGARFYGDCDFKDAKFKKADLKGAKFGSKCNFDNATFEQAEVSNTDFEACALEQWQVNAMVGDDTTKLPEGMEKPQKWAKH